MRTLTFEERMEIGKFPKENGKYYGTMQVAPTFTNMIAKVISSNMRRNLNTDDLFSAQEKQ